MWGMWVFLCVCVCVLAWFLAQSQQQHVTRWWDQINNWFQAIYHIRSILRFMCNVICRRSLITYSSVSRHAACAQTFSIYLKIVSSLHPTMGNEQWEWRQILFFFGQFCLPWFSSILISSHIGTYKIVPNIRFVFIYFLSFFNFAAKIFIYSMLFSHSYTSWRQPPALLIC